MKNEQRVFPRMKVQCPVLYLVEPAKRWQVAKLVDYSATGLRMECDENLAEGTKIAVAIKPGGNKLIPPISGEGTVVRCAANAQARFEVSCKLTKVVPGKKP
jgi:hypothetical protein